MAPLPRGAACFPPLAAPGPSSIAHPASGARTAAPLGSRVAWVGSGAGGFPAPTASATPREPEPEPQTIERNRDRESYKLTAMPCHAIRE